MFIWRLPISNMNFLAKQSIQCYVLLSFQEVWWFRFDCHKSGSCNRVKNKGHGWIVEVGIVE